MSDLKDLVGCHKTAQNVVTFGYVLQGFILERNLFSMTNL